MAIGNIDRVNSGEVEGWFFAQSPLTRPYVTIDGRPARLLKVNSPRADVERALGVKGDFGFSAELPGSCHGTICVGLHAVTSERVEPVQQRSFDVCHNDGFSALDLAAAVATAREPGSVAIVVWDAAHNPAGRAKVLYDIVRHRRPAVLFGFCHSEFGTRLWEPLQSSAIRCCLVRPERFGQFRDTARDVGLVFDTIWLCKPRLPTFQLAEAIAHPGSAMVLDIDDNEEAFSRGSHSLSRAYGELSINKAALYRDSITVRSVASASLKECFGGEIVRHVRAMPADPATAAAPQPPAGAQDPEADTEPQNADLRLVFIGTVRPHKGLIEAARALRIVAYRHKLKITLTVGGTFDPLRQRKELADAGVEILGLIPSEELSGTLAKYDAVLTGYFGHSKFEEVNHYQISSKIGDGLLAGLPVLVPTSPSTSDLADIPGIHLFDPETFDDVVHRLATRKAPPPSLPESFTVAKASETFEALEGEARALLLNRPQAATKSPARPENIVLLWKQNDSNLFGRRVDQIARLLAREFAGNSVYVVELAEPNRPQSDNTGPASSAALCDEETERKLNGLTRDGVRYHTILAQSSRGGADRPATGAAHPPPDEALETFFRAQGIYPTNALVVVFPLHYLAGLINELLPVLQPFQIIADVVDNQLSWGKSELRPTKIADYRAICDLARAVVFNSTVNRDAMVGMGIADKAKTRLIANWYIRPQTEANLPGPWHRKMSGRLNVLYSGDLNNRLDWSLLTAIVDLVGRLGGVLHVVGGGHRVTENIANLSAHRHFIYHGPAREEAVLAFADRCDFAVVPHLHDDLSTYMNPLKIKMYVAIGLPHIVTDVPGIDATSALTTVARDHDDFLAQIRIRAATRRPPRDEAPVIEDLPDEAGEYRALVARFLEALDAPAGEDASVAASAA